MYAFPCLMSFSKVICLSEKCFVVKLLTEEARTPACNHPSWQSKVGISLFCKPLICTSSAFFLQYVSHHGHNRCQVFMSWLTCWTVDGEVVTHLGEVADKPETTVGDSVSTFVRVTTLDIFNGDIDQPRLCNQNQIFLDEMLSLSNLISGSKPHILMRHR